MTLLVLGKISLNDSAGTGEQSIMLSKRRAAHAEYGEDEYLRQLDVCQR
jgi:hypothetical protein